MHKKGRKLKKLKFPYIYRVFKQNFTQSKTICELIYQSKNAFGSFENVGYIRLDFSRGWIQPAESKIPSSLWSIVHTPPPPLDFCFKDDNKNISI